MAKPRTTSRTTTRPARLRKWPFAVAFYAQLNRLSPVSDTTVVLRDGKPFLKGPEGETALPTDLGITTTSHMAAVALQDTDNGEWNVVMEFDTNETDAWRALFNTLSEIWEDEVGQAKVREFINQTNQTAPAYTVLINAALTSLAVPNKAAFTLRNRA